MKQPHTPPPPKPFPWFRTCLVLGGLTAGVIAFSRHHPELPWCHRVDAITRPAVDKTCDLGADTWDWARTQWTAIANRQPARPDAATDPFGGRIDPAIPPMTVYFTPSEPGSRYAVNRMLCSMIRSAAQSVTVSYTDLDDDELAQALIAAHRTRGVTVRVGVDNRNCMRPAVQALIRAGVPVHTDRSSRAVDCNFLVIDEQVVSFGSLKPTFQELYRNNNCLITIADRALAARFAAFFTVVYPAATAAGAHPATPDTHGAQSIAGVGSDGAVWGLFADDHAIQERLVGQLARATDTIDLIAPTLANDAVIEALLKAGARGVQVRLCLDRAAPLSAETRLLLQNSRIQLIRPAAAGQIRETAVVIDGRITACLSGGFRAPDPQPRRELALLINSTGLARIFTAEFEQLAANRPAPADGFAYELSRTHQVKPLLSLTAR